MKKFEKIMTLMVIIIGLPVCLLCINNIENSMNVGSIWIIPISYIILFLLTSTNRKNIGKNIGVTVVNIGMYIRYLILPMIISINDSMRHISLYLVSKDRYDNAIFLMIYEMICVFFVLNILGKKLDTGNMNKNINGCSGKILEQSKMGIFKIILIGLFFIISLIYPSFFSGWSFILFGKSQNVNISFFMPGLINIIFSTGQLALFIYLLYLIYVNNNSKQSKLKIFISFIITFIYVANNFIVGESTVSRWNMLLILISTFMLLTNLYTKYRNTINRIFFSLMLIGIVIASIIKISSTLNIEGVKSVFEYYLNPSIIDSYFSGPVNIGIAIDMSKINGGNITIKTLLNDFFSAVPVLSTLFNPQINSTPVFFHNLIQRNDAIIPLIGQGYAYLGFWGAPLISMIFTTIVIGLDKKISQTRDIWIYYVLTMLSIWFGLFMELNIDIIFTHLWKYLILLLILNFDNKLLVKKVINNKGRF